MELGELVQCLRLGNNFRSATVTAVVINFLHQMQKGQFRFVICTLGNIWMTFRAGRFECRLDIYGEFTRRIFTICTTKQNF
jgi:muramidase (phage lysozyme)